MTSSDLKARIEANNRSCVPQTMAMSNIGMYVGYDVQCLKITVTLLYDSMRTEDDRER